MNWNIFVHRALACDSFGADSDESDLAKGMCNSDGKKLG